MSHARYAAFLPPVLDWIRETLERHAHQTRTAASFEFQRLPLFFSLPMLQATKVVITEDPPVPPLAAWGISEFASLGTRPRGVTYWDTYFLEPGAAESLHFHELVHAIQWRVLGAEDFLLLYAAGLAEQEYEDSPLEAMAYQHQARFEAGEPPYSIEAEIAERTLALLTRGSALLYSAADDAIS